jgi:hypothetical protein
MTDTFQITRPSEAQGDKEWDEASGVYVQKPGKPEVVYEGLGFISSKGWTPQDTQSAGFSEVVSSYSLVYSIDGPDLMNHDIVEILESLRDANLVGKTFVVRAATETSFKVCRRYLVEVWTPEKPR